MYRYLSGLRWFVFCGFSMLEVRCYPCQLSLHFRTASVLAPCNPVHFNQKTLKFVTKEV